MSSWAGDHFTAKATPIRTSGSSAGPRIVADIVRAFDDDRGADARALRPAAIEPDVCGDEDFEYAMAHLDEEKKFFAREAQTGRWIVFSADR